jgi:hypothetical protein
VALLQKDRASADLWPPGETDRASYRVETATRDCLVWPSKMTRLVTQFTSTWRQASIVLLILSAAWRDFVP